MIKQTLNNIKNALVSLNSKLVCNNKGMGTIEIVLIIIDNPFTSSTYILSY